jgi:hypothetical protein
MTKRLGLAPLLTFLAWAAQPQEQKLRICLTANSNVAAASIGKSLDKHCPEVVVSMDQQKANYLLEAIDTGAGKARKPYKFTLFSPDGDRAFSTETAGLDSAVKDVCTYIRKRSQ